MSVAQNLTELIGHTPLLSLNKFAKEKGAKANIVAKLEYFNPLGSIKDRIAKAMINDAEEKGLIKKDTVIIEPTSGNTGIGLAFVGAAKGYKVILVMPDTMSIERRNLLAALGAEIILTPGTEGMKGAIRRAEALSLEVPSSFIPQQFNNPANPQIHYDTTGVEIYESIGGNIAALVAGVGTGGTISGAGKYLKEQVDTIKIIAVEPFDSPVLSGGKSGPHKIQGIGAGFVPDVFDGKVVDEIYKVKNDEAFTAARDVARLEGLLVGISSGAALHAATQIAKRDEFSGQNIVVILPDTGERYLSTALFQKAV
ncbi:MAG: cysteine synthase A [Oscillospiraceae bacterium]|jgi:cysteine synthase A|nr:cysteine synthase A [Oscillospiraceae bacterium]